MALTADSQERKDTPITTGCLAVMVAWRALALLQTELEDGRGA